jgi:hypothetical protein
MNLRKYVILRDTREKNGWGFESFDRCLAIRDWGLATGDYTVRGLEKQLTIERKASTGELALNIGKERKRFEAEMERMSQFRWAYIICEFSIDDLMSFPKNSGIPKKRWGEIRMNGKYMWKKISEFQEKYNVTTLFCTNKQGSEERTMVIFDEVSEIIEREQAS